MFARPLVAQDFMTTRLVTLAPHTDVFEALALLLKHKISGAPVVDADGRYLGVFSEKCCMSVLIEAAYEGLPTNEVAAFLDPEATTIGEEEELLSIAQIFLNTPCRRLPVLRGDRLVGQISRRDVLRVTLDLIACTPEREPTLLLYLSAVRAQDDTPLG